MASWPAAPPATLAEPIAGAALRVRWRVPITRANAGDGPIVTTDRIAFAAGGRLFLVDRAGRVVGGRSSAGFERITPPVADEDGNFYFAGASMYSVDKDGNWRWIAPLDEATTPSAGRHLLYGPNGLLYTTAGDGFLYAIRAADGTRAWRREVGLNRTQPAALLAGIGDAVLVVTRGEGESSRLYGASDGRFVAEWDDGGPRFGAFAGAGIGIVTQRMRDTGGPYPWMDIQVLDECSRPRWSLPATSAQWPALLGPGDELYVVTRADEERSPTYVSRYAPDGALVAGPTAAAPPWIVGADGTVYALECDGAGLDVASRIVAYSPDLREQGRVEIDPYACPNTTPALDTDGVLYFLLFVPSTGTTELVAVETPSPGPAPSSWPMRRHDLRGTGWVR